MLCQNGQKLTEIDHFEVNDLISMRISEADVGLSAQPEGLRLRDHHPLQIYACRIKMHFQTANFEWLYLGQFSKLVGCVEYIFSPPTIFSTL